MLVLFFNTWVASGCKPFAWSAVFLEAICAIVGELNFRSLLVN